MARRWSIGALAAAAGVTVRTLHHYDRIGLVRASERTASGHRRYTDPDARRLYRVRALVGLGLSLDEVAGVLAGAPGDDPATLRDLLAAQLADLRRQAAELAERTDRVRGVLAHLERADLPDVSRLLSLLDPVVPPEQVTAAHRAALRGRSGGEALKAETFALLAELRDLRAAGVPVDDPRVRALAGRWREIADGLGVDQRVRDTAGALWNADVGRRLGERLGWPDPDALPGVLDYLATAREELP
jgi:MerR family transcriptional regulator, thiopeptide resistance regulator